MRLAKLTAAVLFAATTLSAPPAYAQGVQGLGILALDPVADGNTVLTITGQGEVRVAPDVAVFSVGVSNMAETAEAAMRENAAQMTRVMAELRRRGVAAADMQTGRTSVEPVTNYESEFVNDPYTARLRVLRNAQEAAAYAAEEGSDAAVDAAAAMVEAAAAEVPEVRIIGYRANNSLNVRQRNLTEYGALIDALIGAGANSVNGPNFILENSTPTLDEARRRAVAEARRRAQLYADAAGMRVVRLVMIEEGRNSGLSSGYDENSFGFAEAIASDAYTAPTPASPGELTVRSSVNLMFELAPL